MSAPPLSTFNFWLPAFSLAKRELVRFLRQRHRIIGALATPIVFWLLIGAGMGSSFRGEPPPTQEAAGQRRTETQNSTLGTRNSELATPPSGLSTQHSALPSQSAFLHYFFPGTVLMIILFTAIFSTISIIEDRHEGFLQSVLVAPIPRGSIVMGKVLGGTVLAAGQGALFLLIAPLAGFRFSLAGGVLAVTVILVLSFALTSLGFCIAWRMRSTQGFHAIMNLFLMPMWFLSGALFPAANAWVGVRLAMAANPLSYGLSALRQTMTGLPSGTAALALPLGITIASAAGLFLLACLIAASRNDADLQ